MIKSAKSRNNQPSNRTMSALANRSGNDMKNILTIGSDPKIPESLTLNTARNMNRKLSNN